MWIVYILKCRKDYLYTGVTNDLQKRIDTHNTGKGSKFTNRMKPCNLVWHEHHPSRSEAQKKESEIKKWRREKKLKLLKDNSSHCSECLIL